MNNSYSGDLFQSPLSGKFISASTPKKTQKKMPRNIDIFGYLEDPSLTILREDMLRAKSFDSVSTQDLERLYWHLRDYSYYCGRISNYDEALETEKLLEYVFLELKDRKSQSKLQIYSEILNPTFFQNQQMKNSNIRWMQQLINFDEETANKVESIKDRHNSEIKLLETRWKQSRLRPYNKLSPSLRDLAINEQTASTAGDFVTARSLHDDIVHKKKEELKEAQYKADIEYNSILNSLKQRQELELANFEDTRFHKRELLIRKQQNEMNTIEDKANISLYRMKNAKQFKSPESSLPFRGLIRPFINTNQLNANSFSPNLLPPIRPPPLKNENWSQQKITNSKKVIKCVPKTRHKIDFQNNDFDLVNAMEILKKRFLKMTQENNNENKKNAKSKKKNSYDDLFDYNAYYENQRNPAHLKIHVKKKEEETNELIKKQPYFEPVKQKMNVESIMKKVKEKEANKRKPPVIHSKRKPLKPPKRNKFMNEEEEEEYEDNLNENESSLQFKQKVDIITSKNEAYNRIVDGKNKNSNEKTEKNEENKNEKKKGDESELKSIEIIKKGRQKPIEKFFNFKEKDKDELKLFFCEQDKNSFNELNSYNSYSYSSNEVSIIANNSEKIKNSSSTRKMNKKINMKKFSNGGQSDYSYYYSEYSFDGTENIYKDRDGNEIFIFKNNDIKDKSHQKKKVKKQYTKVVKIDYDYTNIKNEYEEEVEEEMKEKVYLKSKKNVKKSKTKSKNDHLLTKKEKEKNNEKEIQKVHKSTKQNNSKNESNSSKVNNHHHSKKDKKSIKEKHKNQDPITSFTNISNSPTDSNAKNNHFKHNDVNQNEEESSISYTQNESQIDNSKNITDNQKDKNLHSQEPKTESSESSRIKYNSHHHKSDKKIHDNENQNFKNLSNDESQSHKNLENDESQSYKSLSNDESQSYKSLKNDESQSYKSLKNDESQSYEISSNDETKLDSIKSDKKSKKLNSHISKKIFHKNKDKNSKTFIKRYSNNDDVLKKDKNSSSLSASHNKKNSSSSSNSFSESSSRITKDNYNNNRNFTYSKVNHINIETEKEKNKEGEDTNKSSYIPKLVFSSTVPLETVKKTKKSHLSKKHFNQKDCFVTPKPNKTKFGNEIEKGEEFSLHEDKVFSSQRTKNHNGRNIAKLASSSKITSKILSNAVNPLNDGSLFGAGVETKSTGVVKIKH